MEDIRLIIGNAEKTSPWKPNEIWSYTPAWWMYDRLNQQPLTKKIIKIADKPYFQALLARARNFSSVSDQHSLCSKRGRFENVRYNGGSLIIIDTQTGMKNSTGAPSAPTPVVTATWIWPAALGRCGNVLWQLGLKKAVYNNQWRTWTVELQILYHFAICWYLQRPLSNTYDNVKITCQGGCLVVAIPWRTRANFNRIRRTRHRSY